MDNIEIIENLQDLVNRFESNLSQYKNNDVAYNEHSCRIEYIDPLLNLLGWDVANTKGLPPHYREVIAEYHSVKKDRPDYSLTLRGVSKFFVEAKKPAVDISSNKDSVYQARKYGWNANHKIIVLTNFEYLMIYDSTCLPHEEDEVTVARFRQYHFSEYVEKFYEIASLLSREAIYSGDFDNYLESHLPDEGRHKQRIDDFFLKQIDRWRVLIGDDLYSKFERYRDTNVLNDVVQDFINQIIFLRICEDKNLPLYHKLREVIEEPEELIKRFQELFAAADSRYNAGLFSGNVIFSELGLYVIIEIIESLYYPQSPYLFSVIEPSLLGKIYEQFLTTELIEDWEGECRVTLAKKEGFIDRAIVATPVEIVKYMVDKTIAGICEGKTPEEILSIRIADISCGSGVYLDEVFSYLNNYCIEWHLINNPDRLIPIGNDRYKLPLKDKKKLLCSCIYGIDIDIHAVEVAKFTLLLRLIENETEPSVADSKPVLPDLNPNIKHGNSLICFDDLKEDKTSEADRLRINPFSWSDINSGEKFDVIIGNPPYSSTEEMHSLLSEREMKVYKKKYQSAHKQFDKYYLFIERGLKAIKTDGYLCYIVPNKFYKIKAGEKLRELIAKNKALVRIDDFGSAQLFDEKTIYSSIVQLSNEQQDSFKYTSIASAEKLWAGEEINSIAYDISKFGSAPWRLTSDLDILSVIYNLKGVSVSLSKHAEIFNGIQTSAERPVPVYWFSSNEIISETQDLYFINRDDKLFKIEKSITKPYFKPTKKAEKGLNSYSILLTDKKIIFPYDDNGRLIPLDILEADFPGAFNYLKSNYSRLVPKVVDSRGTRDVPNATADTWYQYGRTQALTSFINTPKLIVGVLSKEPMYAYDDNDMLIASGGTAGYCAISQKDGSPYLIEYLQAWLSNPYTERIISTVASDFEGDFIARGTFALKDLPFVELDFSDNRQKQLYDDIVADTRRIMTINKMLISNPAKNTLSIIEREKSELIVNIQNKIEKIYLQDWSEGA